MQLIIRSALYVLQETTLDDFIEAMIRTKGVSLPKTAIHEVAKDKKTPVYLTVERVIRRSVARGAINEVICIKVDNLAEFQYFVQHLV